MRKINLDKIKEIKNHFKKFFSKKNTEKRKSKLILNNFEKDYFPKKRKSIRIRFSKIKIGGFFKKNYIPYFLIISLVGFIIGIFIFLGPIFKLKTIEVIKLDNVTNMEIVYESLKNFRGNSIFSITEREVFDRLKDYQDNIRSVKLKIKLPNTINVEVGSFKELFNVYLNDKTYILLENGTITPTNQASKNLKNLNIIKNLDNNIFIEYRKVFDPQYIIKINEIIKLLEENIIDIKLKEFTYYEIEKEIHIETENGTLLMFTLDGFLPIEEQVKNLVIFNKEREQINKDNIRYIDLRVLNRIFYCLNSTIGICNENIKSIYSK